MKKNKLLITEKTDIQLVRSVKRNADNDSFNEICRRYENLFYKICQKYSTVLSTIGVNMQDIFDEKNFIIYHCILSFKAKKNTKLSTWIGNYARYLCLNSINAKKFILPIDNQEIQKSLEENQIKNEYIHSSHNIENYGYIFNILGQLKDERITNIFKHRYCGDKKMIWSQVAQKMNLSTQTVVNLHDRGLDLIRKKFHSNNISDIV
jgi:RNA polymerase sigma factor (sigma-70 family)